MVCMNINTFFLALFSVTLNALAQISLRKTMLTIGTLPNSLPSLLPFLISLGLNAWFLSGMFFYIISIGAWMAVLGKVEVSLAYPLLSIGYLIAALIGYLFLGEHVNGMRMVGIFVICAGIIVISRSA
ncbi:EamA family transporter [Acetobacter fabarum]|uniref:EamA family transporter n=1 Tax=Acetobacter fabarum TaxID=483199 RepID=UPI0014043A52|nr:EamA family transporter [Acetobacter fabarum]